MRNPTLVTGANGQLGLAVRAVLAERGIPFVAAGHAELDVSDARAVADFVDRHRPQSVINAAAYTAVDKAEDEPLRAMRTNRDGPRALAQACAKLGARLLHISTDYVFGCRERATPWLTGAPPAPRGAYAISKMAGEDAVLQLGAPGHCVVRTSWLFSMDGTNFVKTMLRLANEGRPELRVVEDQTGRPTWTRRLGQFLAYLVELPLERLPRIVHFANEGSASWFDLACDVIQVAAELGRIAQVPVVRPISTSAFGARAPRPAYSVLDLDSARALMPEIPHWRTDLRACLTGSGEA